MLALLSNNPEENQVARDRVRKGWHPCECVSSGLIKMPMHVPENHEALGALHPVGHMGEMSDMADAVLYLDSALFATGEILHVDGGRAPAIKRDHGSRRHSVCCRLRSGGRRPSYARGKCRALTSCRQSTCPVRSHTEAAGHP
jgi:hypothetical protein